MKRGCVILADSHQNLLEGIRELLDTMFETVVILTDKKSLFEAVDKFTPELAVVDLSLPMSSEANIARQFTSRYPELKLIILSVHDEPTAVNEVMSAGTSGFVLKRCIATDLFPAINEVFKGGTYISPSLKLRNEEAKNGSF
ncbi:MAG: response regulator [Planctomycetota bacterium]|jgi:DNA-binding NarL/FixJ family response regulator